MVFFLFLYIVGKLAKENGCLNGYDELYHCPVLNEDKVRTEKRWLWNVCVHCSVVICNFIHSLGC